MHDERDATGSETDVEELLRRGNQDAYRAVWIGLVAVLVRRLARDGEVDRGVLGLLGTGVAVDLASQAYHLWRRE
jgi:hypothetical protein